jgi:hypothetical protein
MSDRPLAAEIEERTDWIKVKGKRQKVKGQKKIPFFLNFSTSDVLAFSASCLLSG